MDSVDMFCVGDDRHRVALLEDFLVQAGQSVELHSRPPTTSSDPCLVACTARSLRTPWIVALFESGVSVVALRLDDTPLPGPCLRAINLQSWPARTADRKVGDLVDWLMRQGGDGPGAVGEGATAGRARGGAKRGSGARSSDTRRALLVLLLLIGGGALLLNLAPERRPGREEAASDEADMLAAGPGIAERAVAPEIDDGSDAAALGTVPPQPRAPVDPGADAVNAAAPAAPGGADAVPVRGERVSRPDDPPGRDVGAGEPAAAVPAGGGGAAIGTGGAAQAGPDPVEDTGGRTASLDEPVDPQAGANPTAPAAEPAAASRGGPDDALAHLCAARSLAAARAWADALNWKQRRRANSEPCVERLLARPGYATLRNRVTRR